MKLSDKLDKLEQIVMDHLKESGHIKEGIKSVRNAVYGLYALIGAIIVAAITVGLERTWR
jgi:hypothetical protein